LGSLFPDHEVYAKCEFLAPAGSFKVRGAVHLLDYLSREQTARKIVVPSMGNTALAAAYVGRYYGFHMVGVVPESITRAKDEKLKALGVELVKVAGGGRELLHRAAQIAKRSGAYFVHPHLDAHWTNGYQAIAREILEALPGLRSLVFPVGGGGLLMGLTDFLQQRAVPRLVGCEPYNYPTYAAFQHARMPTIADGLLLDDPHPEIRRRIEALRMAIVLVEEQAIRAAMAGLYERQGLAVEPSSAITAALVQCCQQDIQDPVCLVLTGENIAREEFFRMIADSGRPALR
jgi:threonine dehydratase